MGSLATLVGGIKGGSGKTTIATNLAGMASISGREVIFIDSDKQKSASHWSNTRNKNENNKRFPCVQKQGSELCYEIDAFREKYDTIIIDAGGTDNEEFRSSLLAVDLICIPCLPSQFDLWTVNDLDFLIGKAKIMNSKLKAFIVINKAPTNPSINEVNETKKIIEESKLKNIILSDIVIFDRIIFRNSARQGLCAEEIEKSNDKGVIEMKNLFKLILGEK